MENYSSLESLLSETDDFIANAANFSAYIFSTFENLNWVGFYMMSKNELLLGPFTGKPACIRIPLGKGVCGNSAQKQTPIIVKNVHEFPGHIACDAASNSEIVIPLIKDGKIFGVLDIDSPIYERFDEKDLEYFDNMLNILMAKSNMEKIYEYYNS